MSLLLRLVPEPWATLLLMAALGSTWLYGDLTGRGTERQKSKIARLTETVAAMEHQREAALAIQTRMAERLSEIRSESQAREKQTDDIVDSLRATPAADMCVLDNARRMRLQSIRIGSARPAAGAR